MFANIGDLTSNLISSEKNLPLLGISRSNFFYQCMDLFQLTSISHNAGFSRNQNFHYVENRCIAFEEQIVG